MTHGQSTHAIDDSAARRQIKEPLTTLWRDAARSARERQLLYGDYFHVESDDGEIVFGRSEKDDYVGFLASSALGPATQATHAVQALSSHFYGEPTLKTPETREFYFGSKVAVVAEKDRFFETADGLFVPRQHLRALDDYAQDFVKTVLMFEHVPYLWGGNSACGIDCSGLVQAALLAAGVPCPGDAYQQEETVGRLLLDSETVQRGDLLFWPSHVAIVLDPETIFHATAGIMRATKEPMQAAISRIAAQGEGPMTSRRRP